MTEDLQKVKDLLKIRGCSNRTITSYLSCINRFKNYYNAKEVNLDTLTENDILEYLKLNCINVGFSAATINVNRAAIRYYYLVNFKIDFNKTLLPSYKVKSRFPKLITKQDFLNIINSENNLKHKVWLLLGYGSGLRINEVATLKVSDILSNEHKIRVIGKGNKERYAPLPNITLRLLRLYWLQNKNKITNEYLFPGIFNKTKNTHISSYTIEEAFQKIRENNNLDKSITFHTLRHSFATEYIKSGGDIWELRSLLGHSSINSTMVYLHMAEDFSKVSSPLDGVDHV
ncbi:MAG: tyrosine-type recombinase/integrase [Bacilli bacterium]|nr:tyrosine-type recombinase/integrase [Bacilli bacterium]